MPWNTNVLSWNTQVVSWNIYWIKLLVTLPLAEYIFILVPESSALERLLGQSY